MMTFLRNLKEAKLLDKKIQEDRRELQVIRNDFSTYLDRHPYKLSALLILSFGAGLIASFFLESKKLIKIATSTYIKNLTTLLRYIPIVI